MKLLLNFLYSRRRIAAVILTVMAVFVLFLVLYGVPAEAVLYAVLISGAVTFAAAVGDFLKFRSRCRLLSELQGEVLYTLEHLPSPDSELESGYHELLETLFLEKSAVISKADKRYEDSSDYFAMWAHRIKTPITAMSLALQGSKIQDNFPEKDELAEDLQSIEQYVEMALCYVHLDGDENDFVIQNHPLDEIVKQAVRKFSRQFIRRKLALVYEPLGIDVLTDEKLLAFVICQLISNALKYTKQGSVTIELESPNAPILLIRDTGIGIAAEDLPRVFERGFTGANGRIDKRATGIGLYLCKRICERLGHEISAKSDASGTEIRIDLSPKNVDTRE